MSIAPVVRSTRLDLVNGKVMSATVSFKTNSPLGTLFSKAKHWLGLWTSATCAQFGAATVPGAFGILMYHRLTTPLAGVPQPTWNVSPSRFRQQLTGLLNRGFQAWSLNKLLFYREQKLAIPAKVFAVTFDDAYECVATQALPILRELRVPATVFLSTQYLDSPRPFPFDDWAAKGQPTVPSDSWRPLSTAQCKTLLESGLIEMGAHTHSHADFRGKPVALANDLQTNMQHLQRTFGLSNLPFAFPYGTKSSGFYSTQLKQVVQAVGLRCALHTEPEMAHVQGDPFDWGRFNVEPEDNAVTLAGKLTGWFSYWKTKLTRSEQWLIPSLPRAFPVGALRASKLAH